MEAISNAGAAIGILAKDGVVLIAEKKITSKVQCTILLFGWVALTFVHETTTLVASGYPCGWGAPREDVQAGRACVLCSCWLDRCFLTMKI
jgi:hypothetical protein